jgi:hypothetical protein
MMPSPVSEHGYESPSIYELQGLYILVTLLTLGMHNTTYWVEMSTMDGHDQHVMYCSAMCQSHRMVLPCAEVVHLVISS